MPHFLAAIEIGLNDMNMLYTTIQKHSSNVMVRTAII